MKKVIHIGLLTILATVASYGSVIAQSENRLENRLETFSTFADWCSNKASLTPDAQHMVDVLLEQANTQACDRAEDRLTHLKALDLSKSQIADAAP